MPTVEVHQTQLFYTRRGTGVPCLVMHGGLGLDHTYLRGLDSFSDVLHLVYYDHRHNGRSGRPPLETVTHAQLADDAEGLRQHLGFGIDPGSSALISHLRLFQSEGEREVDPFFL